MADSKFEPLSERDQKFSDMLLVGVVLALLLVTLVVYRSSNATNSAPGATPSGAPSAAAPNANVPAPAPTEDSGPLDPSGMTPS